MTEADLIEAARAAALKAYAPYSRFSVGGYQRYLFEGMRKHNVNSDGPTHLPRLSDGRPVLGLGAHMMRMSLRDSERVGVSTYHAWLLWWTRRVVRDVDVDGLVPQSSAARIVRLRKAQGVEHLWIGVVSSFDTASEFQGLTCVGEPLRLVYKSTSSCPVGLKVTTEYVLSLMECGSEVAIPERECER